jgi:putative ABC transport system permease protein
MLLACAGLSLKSLYALQDMDPGFRPDRLLTVQVYRAIPPRMLPGEAWTRWSDFYQQLVARVAVLPGVESAGATAAVPIAGHKWAAGFRIEGRNVPSSVDAPSADQRVVSNNYFAVMEIPLRRGRYFDVHDTRGSVHVAIINESLVRRYWPGQDPLGTYIFTMAFGAGRCEIVGIVGDVRQGRLDEPPAPGMYLPYTQVTMPWMTLVVRARTRPVTLAGPVRRAVYGLDPEQPLGRVATMYELMDESLAEVRFQAGLLGLVGSLALLLAAVGIYGVTVERVSRRTGQAVIRTALGAGLRPVLMGLAAGLAGAFCMAKIRASLLYGVSAADPEVYAAVSLLLLAAALPACYLPARRAARLNTSSVLSEP